MPGKNKGLRASQNSSSNLISKLRGSRAYANAPDMKTFLHTYVKGFPHRGEMGFSSSVTPLVLVIEDHEDTRLLLRTILEMRGIRVVEALNGAAGVKTAEEVHPDLILMDMTLPVLDGLAAVRLIREHKTLRQVPVVITSGDAYPQSRDTAFAAGCSDYLVKPIDFEQLDRILLKYLPLKSVSPIAVDEHPSW